VILSTICIFDLLVYDAVIVVGSVIYCAETNYTQHICSINLYWQKVKTLNYILVSSLNVFVKCSRLSAMIDSSQAGPLDSEG